MRYGCGRWTSGRWTRRVGDGAQGGTRRSAARRGKNRRRISSEMSARVSDRTRGTVSHLDGVGQIRHDHGVHPGGCRVQLRVHGDSMRAGRHRERGRNRALWRGSCGRDLLLARSNRNRGGGGCDDGRRRRRGRGVRIVRAGPRRRPADLLQLLVVAAHACRAWECDVSTLATEHSTRNQAKTATCVWHRSHLFTLLVTPGVGLRRHGSSRRRGRREEGRGG